MDEDDEPIGSEWDHGYGHGYIDAVRVEAQIRDLVEAEWRRKLRWRKFNRFDPTIDVLRERLHQRRTYHPQLDEERDTGPWDEPLDSRGVYLWRRDAARFPLAGPKGRLP